MTAEEPNLPVVTADGQAAPPAVARTGPFWLVAFVALVVCTNVATAATSKLLRHPELLIALSSRNRFLVATASAGIHPLTWIAIAAIRLSLAALVCHMIGRIYGDRALRWFWRYLGMAPEQVTRFEEAFSKAEWVVVPFFIGSNIVWVLSGAAKTSWKRLAPLMAVGLAGRLALMWWLAKQFESEVTSVLRFIDRYQWPFLAVSIVLVVLVNVRNFRRGR